MPAQAHPPRTILGVYNGGNASATLFQDGRVVYAAQEERFNRVKLTRGYPELAIADCLRFAGLSRDDVDAVCCGAWAHPDRSVVDDYLRSAGANPDTAAERMASSLRADAVFQHELLTRTATLFPRAEIRTYEHHLAHAHTAFYASPYAESHVLTMDGRGDLASTVVWKASRTGGIERIRSFCELKSLGALYGQVTGLLGFTPDRHEGKITGLAAFGQMTDLCERIHDLLRFEGDDFRIAPDYRPFARGDYRDLERLCEGYSKEDVAFAVQHVLERNVLALIGRYVPEGANLCLAGGCVANVKLNQRIREHPHVAGYFVFPEMSDAGASYGGALARAVEAGAEIAPLEHVYLGPEFRCEAADLAGFRVETVADPAALQGQAAALLAQGRVVGLFSGRMEYGPRALGARTILVAATDAGVNRTVNARLHRTEFMPFAPVTLAEHAARMYRGYDAVDTNLRFMTTCYDCTDEMKRLSPAVVHVDGTARPQLIGADHPIPLYRGVLERYHAETGIPTLVNTSFNNHEEPIVCTPGDALEALRNGNVDCVVSDGMLIWPS